MLQPASCDSLTDEEIVDRVRAGDRALFELILRRHNERIYRTVRSILRDEAEVEDAMQQAYVDAFAHLGDFAGRARFSTWLTRIAVHEALARKRRQRPEGELMTNLPDPNRSPEQRTQDADRRAESLRDAQAYMADQAPYIPLFQAPQVADTSDKIGGVVLDPIQIFRYWLLEKKG